MSVHGAIIVPPVTEAAGSAASFLSDANANSDQGLSFGSDQNGLLTKTFLLGNDHAIDLSGSGGVQGNPLVADTPALGSDHVIIPPAVMTGLAGDHVIVPAVNVSVLGGDQVIVPPVTPTGLGDHAVGSPINTSVHGAIMAPPMTDAAGNAASFLSDANTNSDQGSLGSDQAAVPSAGPAPSGALSAVTIQSGAESPIAVVTPGTPVLGSEHLTDSTIVDGSGAANGEVTPAAPPTPSANEHIVAPALATSPAPAASPTLASASLGGSGNDSFAFHPNLGSDTAQATDAHASDLAHSNLQIAGPALAAIAPEFHQEFSFDAIHQDAANLAATVDQFHQMAANSTLLH
jgi:hypothetical protein